MCRIRLLNINQGLLTGFTCNVMRDEDEMRVQEEKEMEKPRKNNKRKRTGYVSQDLFTWIRETIIAGIILKFRYGAQLIMNFSLLDVFVIYDINTIFIENMGTFYEWHEFWEHFLVRINSISTGRS